MRSVSAPQDLTQAFDNGIVERLSGWLVSLPLVQELTATTIEKANRAGLSQLGPNQRLVPFNAPRAVSTVGLNDSRGDWIMQSTNPRITRRVTDKGELFMLQKPGLSMRMFLNAEELRALQAEVQQYLPTSNLTH